MKRRFECGHKVKLDESGAVTFVPVYRVEFFFRWYDLWVGAYWDRENKALYVCPLPTLGVVIRFANLYGIP